MEVYPASGFTEETLKKIKGEIKSLKTGTSNMASGGAEIQPQSVLEMLKMTSSHAKRNILKQRAAILCKNRLMKTSWFLQQQMRKVCQPNVLEFRRWRQKSRRCDKTRLNIVAKDFLTPRSRTWKSTLFL
jgi:hypothetical protein